MVRGPSAYRLLWAFLATSALAVVAVAAIPFSIVEHGTLSSGAPAAVRFWVLWGAVMGVFIIVSAWVQLVIAAEVKAGYTTGAGFHFVDRRDPDTGVVLRAAGEPAPPRTFTLRNARAYAAANPVAPALAGPPRLASQASNPSPPATILAAPLRAPAVPARLRWWHIPAGIGAAVLLLIQLPVATGSAWALLLLVFAAIFLPAVILVAILSVILRARNAAVQAFSPSALLVPGGRSDELRAAVHELQLSPIPLRTLILWAVDESGVSLWQGGDAPVRAFQLAWADIADVQPATVPNAKGHPIPAIAFTIAASNGRTYRLPFPVRQTRNIFPAFPADVFANAATTAEIKRLRPAR